MPQHTYGNLYSFFIALAVVLVTASCEQRLVSREYEEIITEPSIQAQVDVDPHAFMGDASSLGFDHSEIPAGMKLPAGGNSAELQKALDASAVHPSLTWKAPDGWTEEKGSGMRLVTFRSQGKGGPIECSIISLGGRAGGLRSNVIRWMKQINVDVPAKDQLSSFLSRQEAVTSAGNFPVTIIDLSELSKEEQVPSMIAAVAELTDMTIFVKMTGSRGDVVANRKQFKALCSSLKIN